MDAHVTEVAAEARLHKGAGRGIERVSGSSQNVVDNRRGRHPARRGRIDTLHLQLIGLRLALGAATTAGAGSRHRLHAHHLFCDAIGLLLILVAWCVDGYLGLEAARAASAAWARLPLQCGFRRFRFDEWRVCRWIRRRLFAGRFFRSWLRNGQHNDYFMGQGTETEVPGSHGGFPRAPAGNKMSRYTTVPVAIDWSVSSR
jgi:hypothetical protein